MTYPLTTEQKPGYLHFRATGKNSKENVMGYLREIARECQV